MTGGLTPHRLDVQGVSIALDRLLIVLIPSVEEPVDMPANVRLALGLWECKHNLARSKFFTFWGISLQIPELPTQLTNG